MTANASAVRKTTVFGCPARFVRQRVGDPLQLVRRARVLGLLVAVQVEPSPLVDDDVLEQRPEGPRRRVDLRLRLGREPDHLRVAAALEVEDAVVPPAVLVVADQPSPGIGGERRLAGAREPEEDRDVAGIADVGRAVHREDSVERQAVVHQGEDRLLDLAGVERAPDQHLPPGRMQRDERAGPACRRRAGSASNAGACRTSASGTKATSSSSAGVMNIVRAKSAW